MAGNKKKLIIIDANSVIHRAFHALPPLTTQKGDLVNAVYGFLLVFLRCTKELKPDFIVACFDLPTPTFRHKQFKDYKATRPPTAPGLIEQIPKVKEVLRVFKVPIFEKEGFEADDLIGTIAKKSSQVETIVVSGDLDSLQLVNSSTKIYFLKQGVKNIILYDKALVEERYSGLRPNQLVDLRALKGDASDNIPGIKGIGEKTAINLLKEYGSTEALYDSLNSDRAEKYIKPKTRELLLAQRDKAFLSRDLAQIEMDVPIKFDLDKCKWKNYNQGEVVDMMQAFEFHSLIKRFSAENINEPVKTEKELRLW